MPETLVDYRDLLLRYIAYVVHCEGVHCISGAADSDEGYFKTTFTQEERAELRRLAEEARAVVLPTPIDDDYL